MKKPPINKLTHTVSTRNLWDISAAGSVQAWQQQVAWEQKEEETLSASPYPQPNSPLDKSAVVRSISLPVMGGLFSKRKFEPESSEKPTGHLGRSLLFTRPRTSIKRVRSQSNYDLVSPVVRKGSREFS